MALSILICQLKLGIRKSLLYPYILIHLKMPELSLKKLNLLSWIEVSFNVPEPFFIQTFTLSLYYLTILWNRIILLLCGKTLHLLHILVLLETLLI
nr:MAG TPA: hypothetical protein [Caudoviricetes sp.]